MSRNLLAAIFHKTENAKSHASRFKQVYRNAREREREFSGYEAFTQLNASLDAK